MNYEHITRLGDPAILPGAKYFINSEEGLLQMAFEMEQARLLVNGIFPTPRLLNISVDKIRRNLLILKNKINIMGVPPNLIHLLSLSKKNDVEKFAKKIVIEEFDLFLLLINCKQIGFSHRAKFPEYTPSHLKIHKSDADNSEKTISYSFAKKIFNSLQERRKIHAHLLENESEWHCFYFTYSEIESERKNHYKQGTHLHYVSNAWTYNKEETWSKFDTRFTDIGKASHIMFKPFEYPEPLTEEFSTATYNPLTFAIDTNLPTYGNSRPIPLAEITTRGSLTVGVSIHPKLKNLFIKSQHTNKSVIKF